MNLMCNVTNSTLVWKGQCLKYYLYSQFPAKGSLFYAIPTCELIIPMKEDLTLYPKPGLVYQGRLST